MTQAKARAMEIKVIKEKGISRVESGALHRIGLRYFVHKALAHCPIKRRSMGACFMYLSFPPTDDFQSRCISVAATVCERDPQVCRSDR